MVDRSSNATRNVDSTRYAYPGDDVDTATPDVRYVTTYDALGRRDTVTETRGATTRVTDYDYDPITGQVSKITSPEGVINYAYDSATGRQTRTWTAYNDTEYQYDQLGRLWNVIATELNDQVVSLTTTYTYTKNGQLDTVSTPNGLTSDYDYDTLGRLDTLTVKRGTTNVFAQDYALAPDGQRTGVSDTRYNHDGTVFSTTNISWAYDALSRLTSEVYDSSDSTLDFTDTYTFDLSNNRVT